MTSTSIDFNGIPSGTSLSQERIDELHRRSTETGQAFARRVERLNATIGEAQVRFSAEAEGLVASASDADTRRAAEQLSKTRLNKQMNEFRRTLVQSSEDERADMLRQLNAWASEAEQLSAVHATPVQFLGRIALGDARRLNIQQTLAEAGPIELEVAARQAIMTNDLVMAAAIVTVVDRRGKDRRPFSAADFATRVAGVQHQEIAHKLRDVGLAFKSAFTQEREFVRGKSDPLASLSLAVARRNAASSASTTSEA